MSRRSLFDDIQPLLADVERPSRYINSEFGSVHRDSEISVGLCYPGTYEVAQANQAIQILYDRLGKLEWVSPQRVYLPWIDMIAKMRERDIALFTLESYMPVADLDILGITMPYELSFPAIVEVLDLSGIPLYSKDRSEGWPLIIGGGPSVYNPMPVAPFFDAFLIGEGDEAVVEIVEAYRCWKNSGDDKQVLLEKLSEIESVYVPAVHDLLGDEACIKKRVVKDFNALPVPTCRIVPFVEAVHDRYTVEILRGCSRGCRFCQAGMTYRPVRERGVDTIIKASVNGLQESGYDDVSLTSLSSTDHSKIEEILTRLSAILSHSGTSISLPSLRVDPKTIERAAIISKSGKKTGLTLAPEAGTQRLRDVINKNVSEESILETVRAAYLEGWRRVKLYFMIGLPTETDEDIEGISILVRKIQAIARETIEPRQRSSAQISVSVSTFVPKAHTPFQWDGQITRAEMRRKHDMLREALRIKGVKFHYHDSETSYLEAIIARGGSELAPIIERVQKTGGAFDSYSELFCMQRWIDAFEAEDFDADTAACAELDLEAPLPWDKIDAGVTKQFLIRERKLADSATTTPDCTFESCSECGVCQGLDADVVTMGERS